MIIEQPTRYVFDLDGTLCFTVDGDYANAQPRSDRIAIVNSLADLGHDISIYTARGMGRFGDDQLLARKAFEDLTISQLRAWGVKFTILLFGKPSGDIYIDDKAIKDVDFFARFMKEHS